MSFRKRNVGLMSTRSTENDRNTVKTEKIRLPGLRPSPIDGRSTTSTGTSSLDDLLAGHAGLSTGCSLVIEEDGTTDYAGALLRFYAAEGLLQGQHVHVIGLPEQWGRDLPGIARESGKGERSIEVQERMKIAWRYESLGQFGTNTSSRESSSSDSITHDAASVQSGADLEKFCHAFDLTKRLAHPASSRMDFLQFNPHSMQSPFTSVLDKLTSEVANSSQNSVHRLVIPSFLSPALYPPTANLPSNALGFLHGIRALLATYQGRLTVMMSFPLSLYPRSCGLTRWVEKLCDGILEFTPFPHSTESGLLDSKNSSGSAEEPPQGLLRVHKLPIFHEYGSGIGITRDDWTFTLSRKRLTIKPFNLPPVEGDTEAQHAAAPDDKKKRTEIEF